MQPIIEIMQLGTTIPVITIEDPAEVEPLAEALIAGGLNVLEVTLRTSHGLSAIRTLKKTFPHAIVGAGTVVRDTDVDAAKAAGADFLVTPGVTDRLLAACCASGVPFLSGVATPGEAMRVMEQGISAMKFFPAAAAGGIPMLKSINGPLAGLMFCPTGGVNADNARDYLTLDNVVCVGGSWMMPRHHIDQRNWQAITDLASLAANII